MSGTQSTPGGRWQVEVPLAVASSFVARWRGRRSVPFKATPKAVVWIQQEEGTRAKLRRAEFGNYSATFLIPTRGLTMRVVAPERTTRPCFRAGASEIFRP